MGQLTRQQSLGMLPLSVSYRRVAINGSWDFQDQSMEPLSSTSKGSTDASINWPNTVGVRTYEEDIGSHAATSVRTDTITTNIMDFITLLLK